MIRSFSHSADLRIIDAHNLTIDESILTGESTSVSKDIDKINGNNLVISDQSNMAFSGTTVVTGRAKAIVVSTGINTEIGKIAHSINSTKEEIEAIALKDEKLEQYTNGKQIKKIIVVPGRIVNIVV